MSQQSDKVKSVGKEKRKKKPLTHVLDSRREVLGSRREMEGEP